ncbi:MAG: bifunctional diguanylate cyclase/phosphodiesterase [Acidimicrobiales bacterium]
MPTRLIDPLTGLADARTADWAYSLTADAATEVDGQVAVVLVDLRGLQQVNDMFGRADGDQVIVTVADRLRAVADPDDVVLRMAGDEFALLRVLRPTDEESGHHDWAAMDEVEDLACRILSSLRDPFDLRGHRVAVGANVGVAVAAPSEDRDDVLRRADVALYRAKLQGADRFEVYEQSLHDQVSPAMLVEWMQDGLEQDQLRLVYQPIHAVDGDSVVAVEALLRWEHPTDGTLLPDVILPALEDSGLIVGVGAWIVDEACRQARAWSDRGDVAPPVVFVNVSPRQLIDPGFVTTLDEAIARHGIEANAICLELGSLSQLGASSPVWGVLRECKALGVRLALDNFGDNDSSYGLIRRLRLDYVKLGRQLMSARNATVHDDAIAASILLLARTLGFVAIAEGIEDPASLDRARSLGCDLAQGFFLGMAEPGDAVRLTSAVLSAAS